jgi:hypothetical protein
MIGSMSLGVLFETRVLTKELADSNRISSGDSKSVANIGREPSFFTMNSIKVGFVSLDPLIESSISGNVLLSTELSETRVMSLIERDFEFKSACHSQTGTTTPATLAIRAIKYFQSLNIRIGHN